MGLYDRDYMREEEPGFRRSRPAAPWSATIALLVVLAVVFMGQLLAGVRGNHQLEIEFGLSLAGVREGKLWQLLTFQFLHGGIFHVLLNGMALYSFGRVLEHGLGRVRFLVLYFISGTMGGLLQIFAVWLLNQNPYVPAVGASAGIAGLLGAFILSYPDARLLILPIPFPIRAWTVLWIVLPLSVVGAMLPNLPVLGGVAHAAHLGGLLTGGAFIRWTWRKQRNPTSPTVIISNPTPPPKTSAVSDDFIASEVDPILDKIAKQGIHSLTERERKILETARAKMQKR